MMHDGHVFLYQALWQRRWRIVVAAVLGIIAATIYIVVADRMFTVQLVAAPARHEDGAATSVGLGTALGSLGISGIQQNDEFNEALAILRSRSLTGSFVQANNVMPVLFAEKWNSENGDWSDSNDVPSSWDAYKKLSGSVISITEDLRQGLVVVRVTWTDPDVAASWANALIGQANDRIRASAISEASGSIEFLRGELENAAISEVRQSIYSLILTQVQKIMLANTRPDYAFKVIDPAQTKDDYDYPRPSILLPAGAIVGTALYLLAILVGIVFSSSTVPNRDSDAVNI